MARSIRRIFNYHGGKDSFVKAYRPPEHDTIVEPFAGGASYARYWNTKNVTLFDLDEELIACWHWLQRASPSEILRVPIVPRGGAFSDVKFETKESEYLVRNATMVSARGFKGDVSRSTFGNCWNVVRRQRLSRDVDKLRHWKIVHGNYKYIDIDKYHDETWFVDPPYQIRGWRYIHNSTAIDYNHLADWCRALEGQVIVCESTGAEWLPFRFLKYTKNMNSNPHQEAVYYNRELPLFQCVTTNDP